jgi:hypothetical protein
MIAFTFDAERNLFRAWSHHLNPTRGDLFQIKHISSFKALKLLRYKRCWNKHHLSIIIRCNTQDLNPLCLYKTMIIHI